MMGMAERVGFEPTMGSHPCRFSRPVHSTALPPLRSACANGIQGGLSTLLTPAFLNFVHFATIACKFVIVGRADCHMMRNGLAGAQCRGELCAW